MPSEPAETGNKYGFGDRLTAHFPSQVIIDVTELCNLACIHCPHPSFKLSEHYSARSLDPTLNEKVIDEIAKEGIENTQYVRYTGEGEPLLHKDVYGMLGYAVRNSKTTVALTTNGTILDDNRLERLLATGIHVIDISIDAYNPDTYAKIRVKGDLEVTRMNVLNLLERNRSGNFNTKVVVSYVEQDLNKSETDEFEKFWKDQGADYVVIRRLHSSAGAMVKVTDILNKSEQPQENRYPCLYPWERITLNPRGELSFCPQDWVHGSAIVDYRTTTIKEVWQGKFYNALRSAHLNNDFVNHSFCGECPDWKLTRWPNEGRSYANMIEEFKTTE